ncbi:calcium-activated chloride channel regulator 4-like isoform X2 [Colossoma macropomum]|uniref:calcium-activated chloride channel regulator 4-like isoform X2 n=1 Tax=Colossoma macropomum TaxID=42526 RepID=UPI001863DFA1|nr:calcium-activated chloride channel regulator 4-like isoform X2 [Colossoma macropomum]
MVFAVVLLLLNALGQNTGIKLDGNGYTDIVVAINPAVPQNEEIINQIKEMVTSGSEYLFQALDNLVFFKEVKILVPLNWSGTYERARRETYDKANVIIDYPNPAYGDEPYTKQMKGCGEESEHVHFTPNFLLNDDLLNAYGPRGRVFVHEWAHLRWGVYDEYNEKEPFYMFDKQVQETRCIGEITGQRYEVINGKYFRCRYDETGLPTKECQFFPDREQQTSASIMYMQSLDSVTAFCSVMEHIAEAPNMQNKKCDNKATRTVIFQDSVDSDALQTLTPLQSSPPPPTFRVIQRRHRVVCLILDVSGSMQVLQEDDQSTVGDNVIFLTDGEATDDIQSCLQSAVDSGAIINTIALGPSASKMLETMAVLTDGKFFFADQSLLSNQLVDTFSSFTVSDGDPTKQTIQLESTGRIINDWFNGTVPIDRTVGNSTTFTIIYERSAPTVYIQTPSGSVYDQNDQTHVTHNAAAKTVTLNVPGTAEPGDWKYSFLNKESTAQTMTLTVTSRAARDDVPPIMVKTDMKKPTRDGSKPMVVYAEVSQNYLPVLGAKVMATLESDTGHTETLHLLDNGAGADAFKDDGIYSRYFPKAQNGRYSLKVQVIHQGGAISGSPNRNSGALYVPGYIVDGEVQLNPEKPPVNVQPADVGSFTRTVTGESFVASVPSGVTPPNFPPNKITDLRAEIQEDTVLLNWTAPGEDFDQGTAESYEIRWSEHLEILQKNFSDANPVNTSVLQPQEAGSDEQFSFLSDVTIQNGTTLFFAVRSEDKEAMKSEVSNVAQASKFVPTPRPPAISKPGLNLTAIVVSICVVIIMVCLIAFVTKWAMKRKKAREFVLTNT